MSAPNHRENAMALLIGARLRGRDAAKRHGLPKSVHVPRCLLLTAHKLRLEATLTAPMPKTPFRWLPITGGQP